jgi:hypothetical protein
VTEIQSIELLSLLVTRLEQLSADSHWSRRASGLRGNIIKVLLQAAAGESVAVKRLEILTNSAFEILRQAAQEIPDQDALYRKEE